MTLQELINEWRRRLDDKISNDYQFADSEGVMVANLAVNEACTRAKLIYDLKNISLVNGTSLYYFDSNIFLVDSAILTDVNGLKTQIVLTDRETLSKLDYTWREWTNNKPKFLIVEDSKVELSPCPETAYTLTTYHYRTQAEASGTATSGSAAKLTNTSQSWVINQWARYLLAITSGAGSGQSKTISSNTATEITVSSAWITNPDSTSVYKIENLTESTLSNSPEIASRHHDGLVDWMVFMSLKSRDADVINTGMMNDAYASFELRFGKRPDSNVLRKQARKGSHVTRPINF